MTTTAAQRQALGALRRDGGGAPPDGPGDGRARPQLAMPRGRDRPGAARRRRAGRLRGQDPQRRRRAGRRTRRSTGARLERLRRLVWRWAEEHDVRPEEVRIDLVAVLRPRRGASIVEHVAGAGLMPFATAHTICAQRRGRPPRSTSRPTSRRGRSATVLVGRARQRAQRGPRPLPDGDPQQPATTGRRPGGSRSCSRRPTCPSAAPTSTWPSRSRCWRPPARCRPTRCRESVFIGELTLAGGLRSVPGRAADGDGRRAPRHPPGRSCPSRRSGEAAMVPGHGRCSAMRSLAQVVAELRDEPVPDAPPVAPMSGQPAADAGAASSGSTTSTSPTCVGMADATLRRRGRRRRRPPPDALRTEGVGQDQLAERIPGILPDLTREESLELTAIHSLAGALDPGDGMLIRPPFSAPHHDASKASLLGGGIGRVRPGEISRAHCGVLFLDEFPLFRADVIEALRQPLESGEVTSPAARSRRPSRPAGMVVLACNPCPCGNFHPDARDEPVHLHARSSAATTAQGHRPDHRPDRHHPPRRAVATPHARRDPLAVRESSAQVRARVEAARAAPGRPLRRRRLAAQRAGARAGARARLAADPERQQAGRRRALRRAAHPPRRDPRAPAGLDRRRPAPGSTGPGVAEARRRAPAAHRRAAAGAPRVSGRRRMSATTDRLARARRSSRLGEPGDLAAGRAGGRARRRAASTTHLLRRARPAWRADRRRGPARRARPRARPRPRRRGSASGSSCPATPSGRPSSTTSRPASRSQERGRRRRSGCGCAGRCGSTSSSTSVAVVGSRSATTYGTDVAGELAAGLARAGLGGRVRRGVRHRPGGAPGRPGRRRADRRGARLRCRPCLPGRPPAAARPPGRPRRRRLRAGAGLRADADPLPGPQPADRGARHGARSSSRRRCAAARSTPRTGRRGSTAR